MQHRRRDRRVVELRLWNAEAGVADCEPQRRVLRGEGCWAWAGGFENGGEERCESCALGVADAAVEGTLVGVLEECREKERGGGGVTLVVR